MGLSKVEKYRLRSRISRHSVRILGLFKIQFSLSSTAKQPLYLFYLKMAEGVQIGFPFICMPKGTKTPTLD